MGSASVCDTFVLDVTATSFNTCRSCGYSKMEHTNYDRRSEELQNKLKKRDSKTVSPALEKKKGATCANFELDLNGDTFNLCLHCHRPKIEHVDFSSTSAELKGKLVKRTLNKAASTSASTICCDNFRLNLSGETFDTCVCGFPKGAHLKKKLSAGANDELTKKLEDRATDRDSMKTKSSESQHMIQAALNEDTSLYSKFFRNAFLALILASAIAIVIFSLSPLQYQNEAMQLKDKFVQRTKSTFFLSH